MIGVLMKTTMVRAVLLGVFSLSSMSISIAQQPPSCDDTTLPVPIRDLVKSKFPQLRPKQFSDLEADDKQLWWKAHEKECPGIAIGHFESASELSYAILLVPKSEPTDGYKIVVFSKGPTGDAYSWKLLDHAEGQSDSLVISKAEPGKYSDFEQTKSIQTKLDCVYVEWIEKGAILHYWLAGRYHKLRVSD
jgi:hypothetical protein